MNKNDKKILQLKEKIEEKKSFLGEKPSFSPKTKCSFIMFGQNYNLYTMNLFELNMLLTWLYNLKNQELELEGFKVSDWIDDINSLISKTIYNLRQNELKDVEKQLNNLISQDCKTEMEIQKLSKIIGF